MSPPEVCDGRSVEARCVAQRIEMSHRLVTVDQPADVERGSLGRRHPHTCDEAALVRGQPVPAGPDPHGRARIRADQFDRNIASGLSLDPTQDTDHGFFAYFHRPDQLRDELASAGFTAVELIAVEGFGWLLGDLAAYMTNPEPLLRAIRLTETEPSMLGASAHVLATARAPAP